MEIRDLPKKYRHQAETLYQKEMRRKNKRPERSKVRSDVIANEGKKSRAQRTSAAHSKYNNEWVEIDGHRFQSQHEANRYAVLRIMEKAGEIHDLRLQVPFELIPAFEKNGKKFRKEEYVADFVYIKDGKVVVEDAKGYRNDVYRIKQKQFEYKYSDVSITEV